MAIKSILVHVADDDQAMRRLRAAAALAAVHQARITALHVTPPLGLPGGAVGRAGSVAYLVEAAEIARDKADRMKAEVGDWARGLPVGVTWRHLEGDPLKILARQSLFHDLAVVGQSHGRGDGNVAASLPDHLALGAGCPVLVLPHGRDFATVATRVMVAWKAERECARALRDGLPLLARAAAVTVATVDVIDVEIQEVVAYLSGHGVAAEALLLESGDADVSEVVLDHAHGHGFDLLVMGAFGHPRLWELVTGGTTRRVLHNAALPVLMAH